MSLLYANILFQLALFNHAFLFRMTHGSLSQEVAGS